MAETPHRRPPFYRRKYLIKKGLQFRYTLLITWVTLVIAGVVGVGVFYGVWTSVRQEFKVESLVSSLENSKLQAGQALMAQARVENWTLDEIQEREKEMQAELLSAEQQKWLSNTLEKTRNRLIPVVILLLFVIFIGGIFLSHKIAGPIFRFETILKQIVEGDLTSPVRLRKGDELQEMAAEMSEVVESLRGLVFRQREMIQKASVLVGKLESAGASASDVAELKDLVANMNLSLSKYRTSKGEAKGE